MTQRHRDEFFVLMGRAMPDASAYTVADIGRKLIAAASAYQRACEGDCSIPAPDGDYGDGLDVPGFWGKAKLRALNRALKYCPDGWTVQHQNDPRGATLWLLSKADGARIWPPAKGFPASAYNRR